MKKLALGISLLVMSQGAFALSENAKFVAVDSSLESSFCVVAATQGYDAAKAAAKSVDGYKAHLLHLTSCNGVSIREFANSTKAVVSKSIKVVPADTSDESKMCALAAQQGAKAVLKQFSSKANGIVCNGLTLTAFAKQNSSM